MQPFPLRLLCLSLIASSCSSQSKKEPQLSSTTVKAKAAAESNEEGPAPFEPKAATKKKLPHSEDAATDENTAIAAVFQNATTTDLATVTASPTPTPSPTATASASPSASPSPSASAAPQGPSTKGSGGALGFQTLTSKGGLKYQMNAAAPQGGKPQGLLILLHGSTASNYDRFVNLMQKAAEKYGLIRVSVLAPNGQGWNEGNQATAAELLDRLVQEDLYPKFNIDTTKVFYSGQSSGGGFLSSNFIPVYGKKYGGGAFLQCGAAPPVIAFKPEAAMKATFRLHFEITTGDPIWPDSYARAVAAYTAAGMTLTKDNSKPGGHCQFDQQQVILDRMPAMLAP